MKIKILILLSIVLFTACKSDKEMMFTDFVDVDKIDKVKINNGSASYTLSKEQLKTFKKDISSLQHHPGETIRDSSLIIRITIDGKDYDISSDQGADFFDVSSELISKNKSDFKSGIFEKGDFDLKDYKPKNELKLYAISGLGVDSRVFHELELECELIPLEWIDPYENESIQSYSMRLAESIDQSEEFGVLGVSFGGLVATEISLKLKPKLTVLVSTAETKDGLTKVFKLIGKYNMNDYLSTNMYDPPRRLSYFMFGTDNKQELDAILDDTDLVFTKWAVEELVNWENESRLENVINICGTDDRIFPPTESENLHLIEGGGHFMIVDKAKEVSKVINDFIDRNTK
jgi:hypothetical protein